MRFLFVSQCVYILLSIYLFHLFTTPMSLLFSITSFNFFNFAISLLWISINFCNSFRYMTYLLLNPLLLASTSVLFCSVIRAINVSSCLVSLSYLYHILMHIRFTIDINSNMQIKENNGIFASSILKNCDLRC
jgi:hypothetical protein